MRRKIYNTEHRQVIVDFFNKNRNTPLTAAQILDGLNCGEISRSTLYRQLELLTEEGFLTRGVKEKGRVFVYQIAECDCTEHYHLKCASCGRLIHLDKQISDAVQCRLLENDFLIDKQSIMLIGRCKNCKEKENE